jgi:hypothetical protein
MVGCARAFLNMIEAGAPEIFAAFRALSERRTDFSSAEGSLAAEIYAAIEPADLSKDVLAVAPQRLGPQSLGVYCLGNVGWSDLGDPDRLLSVVTHAAATEHGSAAPPHSTGYEWAALWRRGQASDAEVGGELRSAGAVA